MVTVCRQLLLLCLITLLGKTDLAQADDGWKQTAEGEGFKIFQKTSAGSADLAAFRLVGELKATPLEVATAILDREHRPQWMRDIRELRTIRFPKPGSVIEYVAVKTPWIIKDRDFVSRTDVEVDAGRKSILSVSKSVVEAEVPETSDVRGALTEGRFLIEPGALPGTTKFTADMDVDPKGSVPRWIVNHFQKNWPIGMFRSLKNFLRRKVAVMPKDLQSLFEQFVSAQ